MHGPTLTPREAAAVLQREISELERVGVPRLAAIRLAAERHGVDPGRAAAVIRSIGEKPHVVDAASVR